MLTPIALRMLSPARGSSEQWHAARRQRARPRRESP